MQRLFLLSLALIMIIIFCSCAMLYDRIEAINYSDERVSKQGMSIINSLYDIPAPDFELPNINGDMVRLSDLKGKVVVLCFFATWNKSCVEEFEFLSNAERDFGDVVFYGISTGERQDMTLSQNKENVVNFARENGLNLEILFDEDNSVYDKHYYVRSLPATYVIDPDGNIRNIVSGVILNYDDLKPYISSVLEFYNG